MLSSRVDAGSRRGLKGMWSGDFWVGGGYLGGVLRVSAAGSGLVEAQFLHPGARVLSQRGRAQAGGCGWGILSRLEFDRDFSEEGCAAGGNFRIECVRVGLFDSVLRTGRCLGLLGPHPVPSLIPLDRAFVPSAACRSRSQSAWL